MSLKKKLDKYLNVEKAEKEFKKTMENIELEKNDTPAMIIAAFLVFTPVLILVMSFFYGLFWILYLR